MTLSFPNATVTINVYGPSADELRTIVAAELAATLTPIKEQIMTALDDLIDSDTRLGAIVTDLVAAIDRVDTDFAALRDAIGTGDPAQIEAEAVKVSAAVDALTAARNSINDVDPAPEGDEPPAEPTA